jgi:PIN domain nuclease of toxin-antitoxin system
VIVLDTHAWVHWVNETPGGLSARARAAIDGEPEHGVCAVSCWEVAMLVTKGRLSLDRDVGDWIDLALSYPGVRFLPLDPDTAVLSTRLPGAFHGDPADRQIAATCLKYAAPLATSDKGIRAWGMVRTVW